jgi:hypothetical protein
MSLALMDSLICIEMPFFAIAHQYAFQASDYIDPSITYAARLPFIYAFRDAFGVKDVWEDIKYTFRARGVSYKAYEAADGGLHHNEGRQKRIRAGLRYAAGGQAKYWVPVPGTPATNERAPLLPQHATLPGQPDEEGYDSDASDVTTLSFASISDSEDVMYARARRIGYAGYPNVDVSAEQARRRRREEEDGILAGLGRVPTGQARRSARNQQAHDGRVYGAWADSITSAPAQRVATADDVADAAFDGENENPGAWDGSGSAGTALRWTTKTAKNVGKDGRTHARPTAVRAPVPPPQRIINVVETEPERARKDAVDLVSPTDIERERSGRGKKRVGARDVRSPPVNGLHAPRAEPVPSPVQATTPPPVQVPFRPRDSPSPPRSFNPSSVRAPSYRWNQPDDNPWA